MSIICTCIIIMSIICCQLSSYLTDTIHTIVNGSLTNSWQFTLTISTNNLTGVILYCIDTDNNQLGIKMTRRGRDSTGKISLKFNLINNFVPLKQMCGCDPCENTKIILSMTASTSFIKTNCNNRKSESFCHTKDCLNGETDNTFYPMPMEIINKPGKIYVMIGNIGPYKSASGQRVIPLREHMTGCVHEFKYNNAIVTFNNNGNYFRSSCLIVCTNDSCNGGVCRQLNSHLFSCDCSNTALNGKFCNRSIKKYIPGTHNSYEMSKESNSIYVKMTLSPRSNKTYCLMEVVRGTKIITISINRNHLMLNSQNIYAYQINRIMFFIVTITRYYLVVKVNGHVLEKEFLFDGKTKVMVGFSEYEDNCQIFEGSYDLEYDSSELRPVDRQNSTTNNTMAPKGIQIKVWMIIVGSCVLIVIIVALTCTICLHMIIKKRDVTTPGNIIEPEAVELGVVGDMGPPVNDYSELDYKTMYGRNIRLNEDSDGYIIPRRPDPYEVLPELPRLM